VRYSTQIRPISYLKANAAEVLQVLEEQRKPMIITQNGEAKAVIQDVASYEETQETLALLKILALGSQQVERGEITPISEVASRLRSKATKPLMLYEVSLTKDAERDLEEIYLYIAEHDSRASADHVLDRLVKATEALRTSPDRGSYVNELRSLGISEYRQIFFKPYRLIYRVHSKQVIVYVITDGRRDMESLLARRLLGA
jgi:toxin ParE1/3/4